MGMRFVEQLLKIRMYLLCIGNSITPWVDLQSGNAKIYNNNRIEAKTVLEKLLNDENKLLFLVALG